MTAYILTRKTGSSFQVIHKSFVPAEARSSLFNAVGRLCVRGFTADSVSRDDNGDVASVVLSSGDTRYVYSIHVVHVAF